VFKRFRDWVKADVFQRLFDAVSDEPDMEFAIHRQGPPARPGRKRGIQSQAIGKSKGGLTAKILALTDALGNLARFVLLPRQRIPSAWPPLIEDIEFGGLIADKAFDSNWIIQDLSERGAQIVISQRPRCRNLQMAPSDRELLQQTQRVQAYRYAQRQNR